VQYLLAGDAVHRALYLRKDEITDGKCRDKLLSIAAKTVEEYYVAPPGESTSIAYCTVLFSLPIVLVKSITQKLWMDLNLRDM